MKAAQIRKYGHSDVIEIMDVPKPAIEDGKVLVKVYASSINPVDVMMREGGFKKPEINLPITLGTDIAGVVTEVGKEVEGFTVGNKVYGQAIILAGASGAFAEFALVLPDHIAPMPKNLDFIEAGAFPLVGVSALQALTEHMHLQAGQKILIHGGAGGIGSVAIQIAKAIGVHVATTAAGQGIAYAKRIGADQVIDYQNQEFEKVASGYDAILDTVGGQVYEKSFEVLKKGGVIVSMIAPENQSLAKQYGVMAITQKTRVNAKQLNLLTNFIENKNVKVHIDKIFLLDRIKEAFDAKEHGVVLGKIAVQIKN